MGDISKAKIQGTLYDVKDTYSRTALIDLKMLGYTIPKEMPVQNYVDSSGIFHQKVSRVDLGSLSWTYAFRDNTFYADISNSVSLVTYCSKYKNITTLGDDKSVFLSSNRIYIKDSAYGNDQAIAFKSAMSGVYLYYELATEKTYSVDGHEHEWQLIGSVTGANSVNVSGCSEYLAIVQNSNGLMSIHIPAQHKGEYRGGYADDGANYNGGCIVNYNGSSISVSRVTRNNANVTTTSTMTVYGRR